jgi:IS5 family transposase
MKKATKKSYRIRNWAEYNKALVNRGSLTLWISDDAIEGWINQQQSGDRGASDYYSDICIECMLTLKEVYGLGLRQTQGFSVSIFALMKVELDVPNYTTLSRRRKRLSVSLGVRPSNEPVHIVVDSTGLKVYGEGEWKVRQHGYSKRRTWRKLHLGVDEATNELIASVLTTNNVADSEVMGDLLNQVERPIKQVSADGAYDTKDCYTEIAKHEAKAVIPPRQGARIWKHGNTKGERHARDENLRGVRKNGRAEWKRQSDYHRRSKAETAMFRLKTIFSEKLGARIFESQCCEAFIKCAALNTMMRLGMPDSYAVTA